MGCIPGLVPDPNNLPIEFGSAMILSGLQHHSPTNRIMQF